jgi:hypothetical protein
MLKEVPTIPTLRQYIKKSSNQRAITFTISAPFTTNSTVVAATQLQATGVAIS